MMMMTAMTVMMTISNCDSADKDDGNGNREMTMSVVMVVTVVVMVVVEVHGRQDGYESGCNICDCYVSNSGSGDSVVLSIVVVVREVVVFMNVVMLTTMTTIMTLKSSNFLRQSKES